MGWRTRGEHYRPLAKPTNTSGLLERELPWAGEHKRPAAEVDAQQKKPRSGATSVRNSAQVTGPPHLS